tara:strand:- start:723 stop:1382 length:660 start_codon:yes stop_codon:yes gene_type:complete
MPKINNNVLVVSPHADDEVIGCGGTLLNHSQQKDKISWILMTDITENLFLKKKRTNEINKIKKKLKIKKLINFSLKPSSLKYSMDSYLIEKIKKEIKKINPNIIYLPYMYDIHTDHYFTTRYFLSCLKWFRQKSVKKILCYETVSETNLNFNLGTFKPNYYVDISKNFNKKIELLKVYKSEIKKHPFPRSIDSIIAVNKIRGSESGYKFAESFDLIYSR